MKDKKVIYIYCHKVIIQVLYTLKCIILMFMFNYVEIEWNSKCCYL